MALTPTPTGLTETVETSRQIDARELGVTTGLIFRNFINGETINILPVSYSELRRITDQDGHAKGLLRMLTLPIVNSKWDVLTPEEDAIAASHNEFSSDVVGTQSSKERDLIAKNLFATEQEGGMSVPFEDVLSVMALAVRDGFKVFEKVFKLDDNGRIVLQKLAWRDNDTVTLIVDDHGDFNGFRQRVHFNGTFIDETFPIEKSLLYTFGKEENPLYGTPLFLPVYYHMDKKHKLYYISHIAYQLLAVPPRVGKVPAGTDKDVRMKFLSDLSSLGFNTAMVCPPEFEVDAFESKRTLADFIPLIEHHNMMATKAVLAQFMDLSRSSTGRLAGEQQDIFVMSIIQVLKDIEKLYNNWVIPQLIDFNFGTKVYPKLRARPFTDADQEALRDLFKSLMTAGTTHASPEFMTAIEKKMSSQLDMNLNYDEIAQKQLQRFEDTQKAQLNPGGASGGFKNTDPTKNGNKTSDTNQTGKEGNG
jgi:hypothetical protein